MEVLAAKDDVELHAIVTAGARATIGYELDRDPDEVVALADIVHDERNLAASIASGSYRTDCMAIAPCSIKTLSQVANSANDNLLVRAADVHLKERRRLVMVVRETPLHAGHLRLMTLATESGAIVLPPVPGFYTKPQTVADIVDHTVGKVLDSLGIDHDLFPRWDGTTAQQVR
jgi:polyprenyl P-hydroxybenzoate/phenylacrylic acid decarboxylase-like protein